MTVCIAAIFKFGDNYSIVAVSDRMMTAGDVEFEPPQTKMVPITKSIYALIAGDAAIQSPLCRRVQQKVTKIIQNRPREWVQVEKVADLYSQEVVLERKRRCERSMLNPLGMDMNEFVNRQKKLSDDWLRRITAEIVDYELNVHTIVTGLDDDGAHIFVIDGSGEVSCFDAVGFAAIGWGGRHAESQFMFSKHTSYVDFSKAALVAYIAKKRAEVAPGVGVATDMMFLPALGADAVMASDSDISNFQMHYEALQLSIESATESVHKEFAKWISGTSAPPASQPEQQGTPETPAPSTPSNSGRKLGPKAVE